MPKKGQKFVRRSSRQRGSPVIKPFKAPRKVTLWEEDYSNSDVQAITETENAREQEARQDKDVFVKPYPKGIELMSYRDATECSKHGEVLSWGTDSEGEKTKVTEPDKQPQITFGSDTTGSTPDI
jgi:hypothetical protein